MRSKYGIAAQALGVAGLLTVVYLAFLAPDNPDSLSGIDADGQILQPIPSLRGEAEDGRGAVTHTFTRPTPVALTVGTTVAPAPAPVPTGPSVDTPPGSQYDSVVARILGEVARARP